MLVAVVVASCAPARAASPPVPELLGAEPAEVGDRSEGPAPVEPVEVGPGLVTRAVPAAAVEPAALESPALEWAVLDDTAGGWAAVDASLDRSIIGGGSPAYSVAVMVGGQLVRSSGSGDRIPRVDGPEAGEPSAAGTVLGGAVDGDTKFRIASISKVITAIVLLQFVDDGTVALDEPIGERLADHLGVVAHPSVTGLTIEHLLSHTSGIGPHQTTFFGERGSTCPGAAAELVRSGPAAPGSSMRYSNMNTCLAHLLIEQLAGASYVDVVAQRLLAPLGIVGMRLAGTYDVGPGEAAHFARPGRNYMEALGGAGGWIASAADVARIVDALDPATPGWRPLSGELLQQMRRPPLGREYGGYGLGLIVYPDGSVGHTGTLESTHAMVVSRPDGVTWAVLVNGEHPSDSRQLRSIMDRALAAGFPDG